MRVVGFFKRTLNMEVRFIVYNSIKNMLDVKDDGKVYIAKFIPQRDKSRMVIVMDILLNEYQEFGMKEEIPPIREFHDCCECGESMVPNKYGNGKYLCQDCRDY